VTRLRVAHLRLMVPFVVLGWLATSAIDDNSFLWHVRAGTEQLSAGRVLTVDPFSLTHNGVAWRTQSWLAELGYGWLENVTGGIGWVPAMKLITMVVTVALLGMVLYKVVGGHHWFTVAGLLMLIWQGSPFSVSRPALFGFLLLAATVALTHSARRPLWLLPPLFWLWASIHGTFPVGLGLLFLDALRRRSRRQLVAAVVAGFATALTAHGLGAWWIVLQFLQNRGALQLISEWHPPAFANPFIVPLLLAIVGLLVAGVSGRLGRRDLWVVVPFLVFGVMAERNVWPAFIVLLPFAMLALPPVERVLQTRREAYLLNWLIAGVLVLVAVIPLLRPIGLREDRFPSREAVAALGPGALFNGSAVGGYLIYADWPEHLVFIDDRAELYGQEGLQRFHDVKSGVGVEETFAELGITQVLITEDWPLVGYLELLGWEYRYRDENFVVMTE